MKTRLVFLEDTYVFSTPIKILAISEDERGPYFISDRSIYYFGGGGQKPDAAHVEDADGRLFKIMRGGVIDEQLRHYYQGDGDLRKSEDLKMFIDPDERMRNAKLHTAGHLISSVVYEHMRLPLLPLKGFHFPEGPYIEFIGEKPEANAFLETVNQTVDQLLKSPRETFVKVMDENFDEINDTFVPEGFTFPKDKPLRSVQIEGFLAYFCGGTHISNTKELAAVKVTKAKNKNGNLRLSYSIE